MKKILLVLTLISSAASASDLPDDVTNFKDKRDACDHFRGEEAYDEERRLSLEKSLIESCTGTDAELKSLKNRYSSDKTITNILSGYAEIIEPDSM